MSCWRPCRAWQGPTPLPSAGGPGGSLSRQGTCRPRSQPDRLDGVEGGKLKSVNVISFCAGVWWQAGCRVGAAREGRRGRCRPARLTTPPAGRIFKSIADLNLNPRLAGRPTGRLAEAGHRPRGALSEGAGACQPTVQCGAHAPPPPAVWHMLHHQHATCPGTSNPPAAWQATRSTTPEGTQRLLHSMHIYDIAHAICIKQHAMGATDCYPFHDATRA